MSERTENFMRFVVLIISGILLSLWKFVVDILAIFHWFFVLFAGRRSRSLAGFSRAFTCEWYRFYRYIAFVTNERPFPFTDTKQILPVAMPAAKKGGKNAKKKR